MVGIKLLDAVAQASDQGVNGLWRYPHTTSLGPHSLHDLITAAHVARIPVKKVQQPILGRGERWLQLLAGYPHLLAPLVQFDAPVRVPEQGSCGLSAYKEELKAKRDLDLVAICQRLGSDHRMAVDEGPVLTTAVMQDVAIALSLNTGM